MDKICLDTIKKTLENVEFEGGDDPIKYIAAAIEQLGFASEAMNTISVRGKSNVDALLGCMIAVEMMIGEEDNDG